MSKLLYLSGPMTGVVDLNRQAFEDAEHRLRELGFACINPHNLPYPDFPEDAGEPEIWAEFLAMDIWMIVQTSKPDAIVMLPGWRTSRGSLLEAAVARRFDIPVYTFGQILRGDLKP